MGAGRFVCVAMPLGLTIASIVTMLMAMLAGITNKDLAMFEIRTQNLSISSNEAANVFDLVTRDFNVNDLTNAALNGGSDLVDAAKDAGSDELDSLLSGQNITAATLGLADYYRVSLWGYCSWTDGARNCTKAKFNWASEELNTTTLETIKDVTGQNLDFPKDVKAALKTFVVVSKWTQVVYIIAIITAAIELVVGLFAICSRIGSCCTFIFCSIATTAIICASILATVQASVVVGAVKTTAGAYNVNGTINTSFLSITWISVAFSLAAGLFWLFSMCCCGSDGRKSKSSSKGGAKKGFMGFGGKRGSHADTEKLIPTGSYARVGDDHEHTGFHGQQHGVHSNNVPMHNFKPQARGAYEPYSHTAV